MTNLFIKINHSGGDSVKTLQNLNLQQTQQWQPPVKRTEIWKQIQMVSDTA